MQHLSQSARAQGRVGRWLLLYRPSRKRAWLYRGPFYFLAFLAIPLFSIASLGAYLGPDHTLGGVPAVLFIALLTVILRVPAVRADATLGKSHGPDDWHPIIEGWPFPLEPPPPRRPVRGFVQTATGLALMVVGLLGLGLAANGVVWPILLLSGVEIHWEGTPPPVQVTGALAIPLMLMGVFVGLLVGVFALSAGVRLRDRGRRLRARDARSMLQRPGEQPVMLLRSFEDEDLVDPRPVNLLQRRYEESLGRALKQLGPVITVGRPGDSLGFSGAARFYVSQDNWQFAIRFLMARTAAVVVIVGRTEGLWWEIGTALECVSRQRLLFFVPPVNNAPHVATVYGDFKEFLKRWNLTPARYKQMETERRARYQMFRQRSAPYLRETLPEDLNHAFFFDFLPDGQVRILRSRYRFVRHFMLDLVPWYHRLRFDIGRTVWPFMAKLYGSPSSNH